MDTITLALFALALILLAIAYRPKKKHGVTLEDKINAIVRHLNISQAELAKEANVPSSREITYEDIKNKLSPNDLDRYNALCKRFVGLVDGKDNIMLWHELEQPCELADVLDEIHQLKSRYALIVDGKPFFTVWSFNPNTNEMLRKSWG